MVLKLTVNVKNAIFFFYKSKIRRNSDIWNILRNSCFLILAYVLSSLLQIGYFLVLTLFYDVIVTLYIRCLYLFWYVLKEETHG